jgi:hypothetical protein
MEEFMAQLYTVRMKRIQNITRFDARGKLIGTETTLIEQVYSDLPYQTAQRYKERFPDAQVEIEAQERVFNRPPHVVARGDKTTRSTKIEREKIGGSATKPVSTGTKTRPADAPSIPSSSMADVINKVLEKA